MALFQPTNVYPSTLSGEGAGTIDATQALTVSWQVNGNSPMVAYQVKIMQNDTDSTLKFDSGKTTLATPFFGTNSRGEPQSFSMIISAAQLSTAGIVNGYANGYKLTIKQWWNANDAVEQTSASYFITRSEPYLHMQTISSADMFSYQDYTFEAAYKQLQGDAIEWSRWELQAMQNGQWITVDDTGPIYGPGSYEEDGYIFLNYYHNGFAIDVKDNNDGVSIDYQIRCTVQTENGVIVDTGWSAIKTYMNKGAHIPVALSLCTAKENDCVRIEMPKNFPIEGVPNGTYSFTSQNIEKWLTLPSGTAVKWGDSGEQSLDIKPDSDYSIYCKLSLTDVSANFTYLVADYGDYQLTFMCGPSGFSVSKGNEIIWSTSDAAVSGTFFAIDVSDNAVMFGVNNSGTVTADSYDIQPWINGATLQSLTIGGPCIVRTLHIAPIFTLSQLISALQSPYSFWSYNASIQFYGQFNGTLYTGFINDKTDSLSIYRKPVDAPIFNLIANIDFKHREFNDYSALNGTAYKYFFMLMQKGYGLHSDDLFVQERHGVSTITPCWWNYTVLCCEQDDNGDYIVQNEYRFALNVESGAVGNNNKPSIQQNFTQYPIRQPLSANYKSGTLASLIGAIKNGNYVDSASLMDELYALSVSDQVKFLKTRKGQIFQIETMNPVSMQISDKYVQQPAKISLPWVEVGDASNANILGESTDFALPQFDVSVDTMELSMEYRNNSPFDGDSFTLADGNLYLNNPGPYDADDFSINGDSEVILDTDGEG